MQLAELQQQFAAAIVRPDATADVAFLAANAKSSAAERLFIYQHAYNTRLLESLQTDYAGLAAYLGTAEFSRMAQAYSHAYPSKNPSLRWFGRYLAAFLRQQYPQHPLLTEMAAFEWALSESFDAADEPSLAVQTLQAIAPEQWGDLQIRFTPSLRVLDLLWNVPQIWQALAQQNPPPDAQAGATAVRWIVWRRGLDSHWRSLASDDAWAITQLQSGATIADVCTGLSEWLDDADIPQRIVELLQNWLQQELIVNFL